MRKFLMGTMTALLLLALAACSSGDDKEQTSDKDSGESESKTVTFGITPWTSTVPPTEIAKLIVEDMGYKAEEVKADAGNVFIGLSRGDIDVFMDAWLPAHENHIAKYKDNIEQTAVSYDDVATGMVVPTYMDDINKVSDIKGKEDLFNNEMYGIEDGASATGIINDMLEGYDLDMKQVNSSEGGMLAQAQRFMSKEEPVAFFGWRPHTMFNKFDLKVLEDDQGEYFEKASVEVITNKELKENNPKVYEFLSNWSISIDDVEKMIEQIETEGKDPKEVAQNWIDNNQDKVNEMLGK
ncbi:glycine/betaine ABC transporter substrate-binding protein [Sporosarcina sp. P3]|uniref:glycine betaine ABC transporter substrate-binding protein n=1 Tax=Sporosarcina TaxID=1569 RepID=UPI0009DC58C6|nr:MULTISPECIES: glycine betaine ABC transporter substrate-binding protein [Sporosarcina]ARF16136.1 glycine/betaine ABC transporter substrate-binding protein [Sporosarcina ureae]PID20148.1 glycine/betaine ABC transporter substrate-binding protein [Sporosarcina sp. P3]